MFQKKLNPKCLQSFSIYFLEKYLLDMSEILVIFIYKILICNIILYVSCSFIFLSTQMSIRTLCSWLASKLLIKDKWFLKVTFNNFIENFLLFLLYIIIFVNCTCLKIKYGSEWALSNIFLNSTKLIRF
jgi:hypothetical protein